jgi:hypothetical protein
MSLLKWIARMTSFNFYSNNCIHWRKPQLRWLMWRCTFQKTFQHFITLQKLLASIPTTTLHGVERIIIPRKSIVAGANSYFPGRQSERRKVIATNNWLKICTEIAPWIIISLSHYRESAFAFAPSTSARLKFSMRHFSTELLRATRECISAPAAISHDNFSACCVCLRAASFEPLSSALFEMQKLSYMHWRRASSRTSRVSQKIIKCWYARVFIALGIFYALRTHW